MPASLLDPHLTLALAKDKSVLEQTQLPMVTVSASYREDLKDWYGMPANNTQPDIVLSRAHYSMAVAIAVSVWGDKIRPTKAWIVDPTNYVSQKEWRKVEFTQQVGRTLARHPLLKFVKDLVDKFGRSKLPILTSITPPLLHLTQNVKHPILSLHIAAGNILAEQGKSVIQVITDPHVRDDYLDNADRPNIKFCVFDERTKIEFLEKAMIRGLHPDPERIIVTGPPVDPRILAVRSRKHPWRSGLLKLCLTTGGLGTNKTEIKTILEQLLPELRKPDSQLRILVYGGTNSDFCDLVREVAKEHRVKIGSLTDSRQKLRLIYHPQIVDANELLIKYGFPWADGFISKPSGDMAYDAAAAGCFLLTLNEWGEWEHNIRAIFEQKGIARQAQAEHIWEQLETLMSAHHQAQSWVERAMQTAQTLEPLFLEGAKNIAKVAQAESKS